MAGFLPTAIQESEAEQPCLLSLSPVGHTLSPPYMLMVIQTNPDGMCQGTTQGRTYEEVSITEGHLQGWRLLQAMTSICTASYVPFLFSVQSLIA